MRTELGNTLRDLETVDGLEVYENDFLHLTVKVFGTEKPSIDTVSSVLDEFSSFQVDFGGLNLFSQAVVLEALIPEVREINKALCSKGFNKLPHDGKNYLPHISLAHYRNRDRNSIVSSIEDLKEVNISSFDVNRLHLVKDVEDSEKPDYELVTEFKL